MNFWTNVKVINVKAVETFHLKPQTSGEHLSQMHSCSGTMNIYKKIEWKSIQMLLQN